MKKYMLFLVICALIASCSKRDNLVFYSYKGTTVTRIDEGVESYFYYGRFKDDDTLPDCYVKSQYRGFDGYVECFIIFKDNGDVKIIRSGGDFDTLKAGGKMKMVDFSNNTEYRKWYESKKGNYDNVIQVYSALNVEVEWNKINKSKVKAEYFE